MMLRTAAGSSRPDSSVDKGGQQQRPAEQAFNGRFRAECLNAHWFLTLADAREKLEDWRKYYTEDRPLGAIGNKNSGLPHDAPRRVQPAGTKQKSENSSFRRSNDG